MDYSSQSNIESRHDTVQPVEYFPVSQFDVDTAARLAYQPEFSIGRSLHEQFVEAENMPFEWTQLEEEAFTPERFGSEAEAYQAFWKNIMKDLKESDAVKSFRQAKGEVGSAAEMKAVFTAFERAVARAFAKTPLSDKLRNRFREVWTNRDFTLMSSAVELAGQIATAKESGVTFDDDGKPAEKIELLHHPFENFIIANPKLRPIDYWDSKDARAYLRRFSDIKTSAAAREQMKRDLNDASA